MYGLDLFSGIGGITKALEGYVRPVAYCEIDPYARGVLLSRMASRAIPAAPVWDDVSSLRGGMLPNVDIIYGGFPCQDISVAGKQIGLGGERSSLFFEIVRLAKETKAEWIFLENVPNIRTKGLGTVLQTLANSGYDCRWCALSASDVGANHKRERWFLLAHAKGDRRPEGLSDLRRCSEGVQSGEGHQPSSGGPHMADTESEQSRRLFVTRIHENTGPASDGRGQTAWWSIEPNVGRVAHGVPKRVDRLRALGNAVVLAQAREAFERLMGLKNA